MPVFRCCWCQTRSEHPQAGVLVVCPECGVKFNAIDWGAKGKDMMAHQFNVGDIVRLNGNTQEAEVVGFKVEEGSARLLLQVKFTESKEKMYFPENSVTFVRPRGEAPTDHPYKTVGPVGPHKIETTAAARDVTSLWGGGFKTHQRIEDKDMSHQFKVGDIVRLSNYAHEAEVIGFDEGYAGPLLHVELAGKQGKMYFPVKSVTFVRSGGAAQANHPSKLET